MFPSETVSLWVIFPFRAISRRTRAATAPTSPTPGGRWRRTKRDQNFLRALPSPERPSAGGPQRHHANSGAQTRTGLATSAYKVWPRKRPLLTGRIPIASPMGVYCGNCSADKRKRRSQPVSGLLAGVDGVVRVSSCVYVGDVGKRLFTLALTVSRHRRGAPRSHGSLMPRMRRTGGADGWTDIQTEMVFKKQKRTACRGNVYFSLPFS